MLKKRIWWIIFGFAAMVIFLTWLSPKVINWEESFRENNKDPYGSYILFNELESIFNEVQIQVKPLYTSVKEDSLFEGNYIFVTSGFYPEKDEMNNLLEWVAKGNNALISAGNFGEEFLDTLNLYVGYQYLNMDDMMNSNLEVSMHSQDSTIVPKRYKFEKQRNLNYFKDKNDSLVTASRLSSFHSNDNLNPILVSKEIGMGTIYLHSLPFAFTNYYMLKMDNHEYAASVLSYLPNRPTFWDEYYKPVPFKREASLTTFLNEPGFRWAYCIGIGLLGMFLIFKFKRNQRAIPIINPPENRTLEYASTVGDLYYNTNDTQDLIQKMEKHYKEFIREKYYISDYGSQPQHGEKLAAKSGRTIELITGIDTMLGNYKRHEIKGDDLIRLNQKLHLFYYGGK